MLGPSFRSVDRVPAGNIVGILGLSEVNFYYFQLTFFPTAIPKPKSSPCNSWLKGDSQDWYHLLKLGGSPDESHDFSGANLNICYSFSPFSNGLFFYLTFVTLQTIKAQPMVRVAVEPLDHKDLGRLEAGLQSLYQYDPVMEVS